MFALCSGAGEIDAAAGTQLLITKYDCGAILNFGVTGALDPGLRVEDLLVVRKTRHYDFDTSAVDDVEPNQYAEFPDPFLPLDGELIGKAKVAEPGLREAAVASGDRFVEDRAEKTGCGPWGATSATWRSPPSPGYAFSAGFRACPSSASATPSRAGAAISITNVERSAKAAFRALRAILERPEFSLLPLSRFFWYNTPRIPGRIMNFLCEGSDFG